MDARETEPVWPEPTNRAVRADAQRSRQSLLQAAKAVFARSGVDAPVREIAEEAGVGVGTLYRHFPQRADLVAAVFRHEIDACADAAQPIAEGNPPGEAVTLWIRRYMDFIATKRGLSSALHSGDPAFDGLPDYFKARLRPALDGLLTRAIEAGAMRPDVDPDDLLRAVASLSSTDYGGGAEQSRRMVDLLVDGLRYRAGR